MVFWICFAAFITGAVLLMIGYYINYSLETIGIGVTVGSGFVLAVMVIFLADTYSEIDAKIEQAQETYKALTYKVESGACRDDFGLLNKEVIDEIQDWNEDIICKQKMHDNFWFGIFYPGAYDQFETIDYERYGREKGD